MGEEQRIQELALAISNDPKYSRCVFEVSCIYFAFHKGEILTISNDAGCSPRGGWFPAIVSRTSEEKEKYLASLPENVRQKAEIARMKGLGEMDAEELNETTMDIEKRILRKITVNDCMAADAVFAKLMGDEVEPRRQFIEENAVFVQNLDA